MDTDSNSTLEIFRPWPAARHASAQSAYELKCEAVSAFSIESPGGTSRITGWLDGVDSDEDEPHLAVYGVQVPQESFAGLQKTTAIPKDFTHIVPKPVIVIVKINRHPIQALLDPGSLGDFMSTMLADQLKVQWDTLAKPLSLQLAVQGSHSKVNCGTKVSFEYQDIKEEWYFDIANILSYDLILGMLWLFQHGVFLGQNGKS